jgi:DNA-binding HxlR family transcriptional regulator
MDFSGVRVHIGAPKTRLGRHGFGVYGVTILTASLSHFPDQYRPVGEIFSLIGEKWTVVILAHLGGGKMRFNELRRKTVGISQKVLAGSLRELERDGFVTRTIYPVIPPRVEYELTDMGRMLLDSLLALGRFAMDHHSDVEAARRRFDGEAAAPVPSFHRHAFGLPQVSDNDAA